MGGCCERECGLSCVDGAPFVWGRWGFRPGWVFFGPAGAGPGPVAGGWGQRGAAGAPGGTRWGGTCWGQLMGLWCSE